MDIGRVDTERILIGICRNCLIATALADDGLSAGHFSDPALSRLFQDLVREGHTARSKGASEALLTRETLQRQNGNSAARLLLNCIEVAEPIEGDANRTALRLSRQLRAARPKNEQEFKVARAKWRDQVFYNPDRTAAIFCVAYAIAARLKADTFTCWPSYSRLAKDAGLSRRCVVDSAEWLIFHGHLVKGRARRGRGSVLTFMPVLWKAH